MYTQILILAALANQPSFCDNLFKVFVEEERIYRINASDLANLGVALEQIDPATIHMFNNGGRELPESLEQTHPQGLNEVAIYVHGDDDGRFDEDDYILFYGRSVHGLRYDDDTGRFSYHLHHYTDENVYWLCLGGQPGRRMRQVDQKPVGTASDTLLNFRTSAHFENEMHNLWDAGKTWFWGLFTPAQPFSLTFPLLHPVSGDSFKLAVRLLSRERVPTQTSTSLFLNNVLLSEFILSRDDVYEVTGASSELLRDGENNLELQLSNAVRMLDWFEVDYSRKLVAEDEQLSFMTDALQFPGSVYDLGGFSAPDLTLFDITAHDDVAIVSAVTFFDDSTNHILFQETASASRRKQYFAAAPAAWINPDAIVPVTFNDLREANFAAEYVIITHEDFLSAAQRLASFRQQVDNLTATVVQISDIFDNFSGGVFDPVAIRDFLKFAFDNWSVKPRYVLLLGDGDFDYKNITSLDDKNWIPPFEIDGNEFSVRAADDWYGYLEGADQLVDLTIGRLPVQTLPEANTIVDKIIEYETGNHFGPWRTRAVAVADDELTAGGIPSAVETIFTSQAESISEESLSSRFHINKVYLVGYPAQIEVGRSGVSKPQARRALIDLINRGALLINYNGHSNRSWLAHEKVFDLDAVDELQNGNMLPIFFSASSQFPKFDHPEVESVPERLIKKQSGGAIAIIGSIGLVNFATTVFRLNHSFCEKIVENPELRLGEALTLAKIAQQGSFDHVEKFHLLGDPALRLSYPRNQLLLTSIQPDSIRAQTLPRISGSAQGNEPGVSSLSGIVTLDVFGPRHLREYQPEVGSVVTYFENRPSVFSGTVPINDGSFSAAFNVPAEVADSEDRSGEIRLYGSGSELDAVGVHTLHFASGRDASRVDTTSPVIDITVLEGGLDGDNLLSPDFTIHLSLKDSSGINTFDGNGVILFLNGDSLNLTEQFTYLPNSFTEGAVNHAAQSFPDGPLELRVLARDNFGNVSEGTFEFVVVSVAENPQARIPTEFELYQNFPNPFNPETTIRFSVPVPSRVRIRIFNVLGQPVTELLNEKKMPGHFSIQWDGKDENGSEIASGVYILAFQAAGYFESRKILKLK